MNKLKIKIIPGFLAFLLAFSFTAYQASAHGDEDHSATAMPMGADAQKVENMKKLAAALQQLVVLLKQKSELAATGKITTQDHHANGAGMKEELVIWVELHSNKTHVHVRVPGEKEVSFLLENLKYTEEEAIIEAVADKTGLSEHEIEEVIDFPSGEVDAHGDSVDGSTNYDKDADLKGIHIMSDGKIMWGNGSLVAGATITADGKIKLSDGRIVEPAFDLR